MNRKILCSMLLAALATAGCRTVHRPEQVNPGRVAREGTVVFVRPDQYSVFGTRSLSDYVEVIYENPGRNNAGMLEIKLGLRNRGGQHFWDVKGPDQIQVSVKTAFYDQPLASGGRAAAPLYETNWRTLSIPRGSAVQYQSTCPQRAATHYQVTISEVIQ
jgi:hypothetical protein